MHIDVVLSSTGDLLMKNSYDKKYSSITNGSHVRFGRIRLPSTCESAFRTTSHLCVKRERPSIITYSLYSETITHYHFYIKHIRGEE